MKTEIINVIRPECEVNRNEFNSSAEQDKKLPRMKTINEMIKLTGLSYTYLRNLCLLNEIVHIRVGKKYLINYDKFIDYLNGVGHA